MDHAVRPAFSRRDGVVGSFTTAIWEAFKEDDPTDEIEQQEGVHVRLIIESEAPGAAAAAGPAAADDIIDVPGVTVDLPLICTFVVACIPQFVSWHRYMLCSPSCS